MAIFSIFTRMGQHVDLMDDMMVTLGVRQSIAELPGGAQVMRRAAIRCFDCKDTEACQMWLDEHREADAAPAFCRNRDLFARVKRREEAAREMDASA